MARLNESAPSLPADATVSRPLDDNQWPPSSAATLASVSSGQAPQPSSLDHHLSSWSTHPDRRRLTRQNRDLAKSNNWRGLRIRELEAEQTCLLSENLTLQTRILELEHDLARDGARRIAEHALEIKGQLEAQLQQWSATLAGLGLEPTRNRRSRKARGEDEAEESGLNNDPRTSILNGERASADASHRRRSSLLRPSPSQRRLRDMALQIEQLGHIPEGRSSLRKSMDSQEILALQAQSTDNLEYVDDRLASPELGPPPVSQFVSIDDDDDDDNNNNNIEEHVSVRSSPTHISPSLPEDRQFRTESRLHHDDDAVNTDSPSPFSSPLDPEPRIRGGRQRHQGDETAHESNDGQAHHLATATVAPLAQKDLDPISPTARRTSPTSSAAAISLQQNHTQSEHVRSPRSVNTMLFAANTTPAVTSPVRIIRTEFTDDVTTEIKPSARHSTKRKRNSAVGEDGRLAEASAPRAKRRASSGAVSRARALEPLHLENDVALKEADVFASTITVARPPLAAKSTNEDVSVSPAKTLVAGVKDPMPKEPHKPSKDKDKAKDRATKRKTRTSIASAPGPAPDTKQARPSLDNATNSSVPDSELPPPAPGGTPGDPPVPAVAVFVESHRPSRRASAAVSYAEPNLRDKMRRPGKSLADAVGPRRPSGVVLHEDVEAIEITAEL